MCARAFALLLFSLASATHWHHGTIEWTIKANSSTYRAYNVQLEFGFRRSFPWPAAPPGSSIPPNVGNSVNTGSIIYFYPMGAYTGNAPIQFNIQLVDKVNYIQDDLFMGTQVISPNFTTYLTSNWRYFYSECCRLSSIKDLNNDVQYTLAGVMNRFAASSPRIGSGLPRYWFPTDQSAYFNFHLFPTIPIIYNYASKFESGLFNPWPTTPVAPTHLVSWNDPSQPQFLLNNFTGDITWTPIATGLYALSFVFEELCLPWQGVSCFGPNTVTNGSTVGKGVTPLATNCCSRTPFDILFEVVLHCNATTKVTKNCQFAPYFYSPFPITTPFVSRTYEFVVGIPGQYVNVCARSDELNTTVNIERSLPFANTSWNPTITTGNPVCYNFSWTPQTVGEEVVCFYATSATLTTPTIYTKSYGQYCVRLLAVASLPTPSPTPPETTTPPPTTTTPPPITPEPETTTSTPETTPQPSTEAPSSSPTDSPSSSPSSSPIPGFFQSLGCTVKSNFSTDGEVVLGCGSVSDTLLTGGGGCYPLGVLSHNGPHPTDMPNQFPTKWLVKCNQLYGATNTSGYIVCCP